MVDYTERLQMTMQQRSISITALAEGMQVTYQAVKKVLDRKVKAFGTTNNVKAAAFLNVDPQWLATGIEPVHRSTQAMPSNLAMELAWTFDTLTDKLSRNRAYAAATNAIAQEALPDAAKPRPEQPQSAQNETQRE